LAARRAIFLVVLGFLSLITLFGPGSNLRLGHCHRRQPIFTALDFFGQADAVRNVGLIRLFRQAEEFLHLSLELGFQLFDVSVRERAVPSS
jgi:hypothetical protein